MHSSFNFYLSNEVSNEKVTKTKVVYLEILSKFGIQKFFIRSHEEGEKAEFTNWTLELRVIYRTALAIISFPVATPSPRRLVAGSTTRRLVEPSSRRLTIQQSQVRFLLSVSPIPEPSLSSPCPGSSPAVAMAAELSSPRTSASAPFLPNPRAPQASPPSIDASQPIHHRPLALERCRR